VGVAGLLWEPSGAVSVALGLGLGLEEVVGEEKAQDLKWLAASVRAPRGVFRVGMLGDLAATGYR
jgi:hypothetical protein